MASWAQQTPANLRQDAEQIDGTPHVSKRKELCAVGSLTRMTGLVDLSSTQHKESHNAFARR
jgi:hypothetical protein